MIRIALPASVLFFLALKIFVPGLWFLDSIPAPLLLTSLLVACLSLWPQTYIQKLKATCSARPWQIGTLASLCGPVFYLFRQKLFLPPPAGAGDSLHLLEHVPVYAELFGYLDSFDEPLELWIRSRAYLALKDQLRIEEIYALLSALAGTLFVLVAGLKHDPKKPALELMLLLSAPFMAQFAGYAEGYTLVLVPLSLTLWHGLALCRLPAKKPGLELAKLGALAAFAFLMHGIAAFLLPALLFATLHLSRSQKNTESGWLDYLRLNPALFTHAASALLGALAVLLPAWLYFLWFSENPVDIAESFAANPAILSPANWLSLEILSGKSQAFLAAAPFLMPLLLLFAGKLLTIVRRPAQSPGELFLLISLGGFLFHFVIWNPMIGFPADRDLFSIFSLAGIFLACALFQNAPEKFPALPGMIALNGAFLVGWIAFNTTPAGADFLERSHARSQRVIQEVRQQKLLEIPDLRYRKKAVKALLFLRRMQEEKPACIPVQKLEKPVADFFREARLNNIRQCEKLWQELAGLNREISEKCPQSRSQLFE